VPASLLITAIVVLEIFCPAKHGKAARSKSKEASGGSLLIVATVFGAKSAFGRRLGRR
jgi:hypothetical protein